MYCPFCNAQETKVIDSRFLIENYSVRRRRKCETCQKRFTTFEEYKVNMPMVEKNDGRREQFERKKIKEGLLKACQKRPVAIDQIDRIIENIEKSIIETGEKEISTREIGKMLMEFLRILDPVAYVRFASVYRTFTDVDEFLKDLKSDESKKFHQFSSHNTDRYGKNTNEENSMW